MRCSGSVVGSSVFSDLGYGTSIFPHQAELVAIDETGHAEIGGGKNPEDANLGKNLADGGPHGVGTDVGPDAKGAGEEPRDALPDTGNA